ncbi:urease accessory protein UreE [Burkholderiales bacterium JOSHI_001]|nr:urease accessory protein UreE [Burkholderiales bacterium JOSHI_001]
MLTIDKLLPQGRGLAAALRARAPSVALDWDLRRRSRFEALDSSGRRLAVFLPRGTVLRGGDVLVAEDGSLVQVQAAPQAVLRVTVPEGQSDAFALLRAAYHLGNRHVELELKPDHLKLEPDPVLAEMLQRLHLQVQACEEPFEPEGGAYAAGGHGHGHGHAHHDHDDPAHTHPH